MADRRCRKDDGPSGTDVGVDRPKHKRTYRREQWRVLVEGTCCADLSAIARTTKDET